MHKKLNETHRYNLNSGDSYFGKSKPPILTCFQKRLLCFCGKGTNLGWVTFHKEQKQDKLPIFSGYVSISQNFEWLFLVCSWRLKFKISTSIILISKHHLPYCFRQHGIGVILFLTLIAQYPNEILRYSMSTPNEIRENGGGGTRKKKKISYTEILKEAFAYSH